MVMVPPPGMRMIWMQFAIVLLLKLKLKLRRLKNGKNDELKVRQPKLKKLVQAEKFIERQPPKKLKQPPKRLLLQKLEKLKQLLNGNQSRARVCPALAGCTMSVEVWAALPWPGCVSVRSEAALGAAALRSALARTCATGAIAARATKLKIEARRSRWIDTATLLMSNR